MLNFVFILAIFFEIFITSFLVVKLIEAQKVVEGYNGKLVFGGKVILELNKGFNKNIKKINKVVAIFSNKNILLAIKIVRMSISIIQVILFIRTINFSKGFLLNIKAIKKLLFAQVTKELIKKICKYL